MANTDTFLRWWQTVAPAWLQNYWGQRLSGTVALFSDLLTEGMRQAVRMRWALEDTPPDALPYLGDARLLRQYPYESETSWRATLKRPWYLHGRAGSPQSVLENLARLDLLYVPDTLIPIEWAINELPTGYVEEDFAYSIVLTNVSTLFNGSYVYGVDAPPYDGSWCYGTKLPPYIVNAIKEVCADWGPFRSKLVGLECTG
jgi:hypothetical protein